MELNKFLVKAKSATYASEGEGGEKILDDRTKELAYEEGEFRYRDRYFGFNPFSGEEVVWQNGKVIWVMNYYGNIETDSVDCEKLYAFLQKSMRQIGENRPFRGPNKFQDGDFEYFDESTGDVGAFRGEEKILLSGQEVYKLVYHGGFVGGE